ncbi:hypothetical protein KBB96_00760 [Luteolibacter ambystomatis]|uniref:Uncharacterized protein n=1 Tax=Luteolibacter ambystomatis TaxID=2824561 RepID=A0A975G9Q9_9BACT|nr:hypothetical protein [Luteolibacter ambystomatis]QUE51443.1 hypothetical protein KBB96_00760 [Luteolibacter ambystomatis]
MNPARPSTRIVLLQIFVIFAGIGLTAVMLKSAGYPDEPIIWNPNALFVRHWGLSLLVIPAAWAVVVARLERDTDFWNHYWTGLSGFVVLIVLAFLLLLIALKPQQYTLIVATPKSSETK